MSQKATNTRVTVTKAERRGVTPCWMASDRNPPRSKHSAYTALVSVSAKKATPPAVSEDADSLLERL